jgi:WD40 repeat protein
MADYAVAPATSKPDRPDAFISYSRKDQAWVQTRLFATLEARGKDVWIDLDDIRGGASDWRATIWSGIEAARVVIFVLSPASLESRVCGEELEHAVALNKRIIPVLRSTVDSPIPEALERPNWIAARDEDDQDAAIDTLVAAIETDEAWLETHARITQRTAEWLREGRNTSYLLRGTDLRAAELWLDEQVGHEQRPTPDQVAYVKAGRRASARRQRLLLAGVTVALGVSVVLGIRVYAQGRTAQSEAFAAQALNVVERDPEEGLRLALRAADLGHGRIVKRALREAVGAAGWTHILRERSPHPLVDVAVSPDGRLAVTGSDSATASLWDLRTGARVASLRHAGAVQSVQFSPDGRRIATAALDGTARIWDTAGRALRTLRAGATNVWSAAFDAAGRRVMTATDGAARVWDIGADTPPIQLDGRADGHLAVAPLSRDGRRALTPGPGSSVRLWTLSPRPRSVLLRLDSVEGAHATVAAFSPDGRHVVAGDTAGTACLWTLRGRASGRSCRAYGSGVTAADFSADGSLSMTASTDGTAEVRPTAGGGPVVRLRHGAPIYAAAFSRGTREVVTAGEDRTARIWTTSGRLERALTGHTGAIGTVSFSPDGSQVVTGSADASARTWTTRADTVFLPGRPLRDAELAFSPDSRRLLAVDPGSHRAVVWNLREGTRVDLEGALEPGGASSPCGEHTGCAPWGGDSIVGVQNATATIWDARSGASRALGIANASGAAFSPDGRRVAVIPADGDLDPSARGAAVRAVAGGRATSVPRASPTALRSAVFAAGGRLLLTVDFDRRVRLSNATSGTSAGPGASAVATKAVAVSRDGALLAVAAPVGTSDDERLEIHDVARATVRATAPQLRNIASVAFDPKDSRIVTAGQDGTARVWDVRDLDAPLAVLRGHDAPLRSAEFSPDGRFVLTTAMDSTARLWDPELETTIATYPAGARGGARLSPDGELVAIGGRDTVELHRCRLCAPFDELVRVARLRLPPS